MVMDAWCRLTVFNPDGTPLTSWSASGPGRPGLSVVGGLAALVLAARRSGHRTVLADACADLLELLELVGLRPEVVGDVESREQPFGVEEGMEPGDPPG